MQFENILLQELPRSIVHPLATAFTPSNAHEHPSKFFMADLEDRGGGGTAHNSSLIVFSQEPLLRPTPGKLS